MHAYDIIRKKRDGGELTDGEIRFFVGGVTDGSIPDYQISALLMAIYFRGMTQRETQALTLEMARSGEMLDTSMISGITADKHSTGGVGDKTSLIVVPIVSACGVKMPKMSGRGLGHTGGTIDKLESIPGFNTALSQEKILEMMDRVGACIIGQSKNLAPADKKLYALRDVTATVDSLPLIASSIMSKKLASGADVILLDVKYGAGAFMQTKEAALKLASEMVRIGTDARRETGALITNMDAPLGNAIGNALEVEESVRVLRGEGPEDLTRVCVLLAAGIFHMTNKGDYDECVRLASETLQSGRALDKFRQIILEQGGDVSCIDDTSLLPRADYVRFLRANKSGYIGRIDAQLAGGASVRLGAGRMAKDDPLDYGAGIILEKTLGDKVDAGDVIAKLYTSNSDRADEGEEALASAIEISAEKPEIPQRAYAQVNARGVRYFD